MKTKTLWIQIESSKAFSVGAKDDSLSVPVVWASGEAGWFEIVPSPAYQRTCEDMFEGVCLHYALLDQYEAALEKLQKSKKKKKATMADVSLDLDELLFQYALRVGDGVTLQEAHARLMRQADFLISHFPRDTELWKRLANQFPHTLKLLENKPLQKAQMERRQQTLSQTCSLIAYDYPHDEQPVSVEVPDGKKKGRGRTRNSAPRTTRTAETSDAETANLPNKRDAAQSSRSARAKRRSPPEITNEDDDIIMVDSPSTDPIPPITSRDHQGERHKASSPIGTGTPGRTETSGHVLVGALEDVRRHLAQLISQGEHKKQLHEITAKSWQTKVYLECNIKNYSAVQEIFHYHAQELVQRLDPKWHDTQIYQWAKDNASKPVTLTLISETEVKHIVRRVKKAARGARTEKAATENSQPKFREYAGKQTPRGRPSGKAAGLRPSTGSKKRWRNAIEFEDEMDLDEDGLLKKKFKRSHYFTEEEGEDEDEEENEEDDDNDSINVGDEDSGESKSQAENDGASMTQLVIRAEKLPSTQAEGPNQTWICKEPDCGYIVRAAHEEKGLQLISAHYEEHEKEAQDMAQETALNRVNLAVQEASRGHMPINHLLEKIRQLGEKSNRREEVHLDDRVVPEPIKRTLLI
ncbi:hypothetical protein SAMD00023353_5000120 [Rosellinia necatrix]|uniref:Uncharacterized protein n=1 Tax=Rosellinia necatrix TaxID=77044 RepID=A0A1S8A9Z9_ROSNE|nr:hypothetical protein SAMD00023353_5000120 [Rosellinia necatrix]